MNRVSKEVNKDGEEMVELEDRMRNVELEYKVGDVLVENGNDVVDSSRKKQDRHVNDFYHTKKLVAEGMMDLSLLTANANQLKFILFFNKDARLFYPALVLIILSLILQVAVGILLIFRRRFKSSGQRQRASIVNEYLVLLIFLTTLINILVAVFSPVEHSSLSAP